jgi:prevent-host-death family protein
MRDIEISVAQGKKDFTKIIRHSSQSEGNVIITKRGTPTAVIMSFDAYQRLKRRALYAELMELRGRLSRSGITAREAYEESRWMLEEEK